MEEFISLLSAPPKSISFAADRLLNYKAACIRVVTLPVRLFLVHLDLSKLTLSVARVTKTAICIGELDPIAVVP